VKIVKVNLSFKYRGKTKMIECEVEEGPAYGSELYYQLSVPTDMNVVHDGKVIELRDLFNVRAGMMFEMRRQDGRRTEALPPV